MGGDTGATSVPPPGGGVTRTFAAVGSHCFLLTGSPGPGTSGENRANACARSPGLRTIRTAVSWPGCSATAFVGRAFPVVPMSCSFASPDTKQDFVERFRRRSR